METRLTETQLSRVVAEVDRMQRSREAEVDRQQVLDILQDLGLPPDLLDEALIQVKRREALAVQQQRRTWAIAGASFALVLAILMGAFFLQSDRQSRDRIAAAPDQSRLVLADAPDRRAGAIDRNTSPEAIYRVTLQDAPIGKQLDLGCNWIAPTGQIVKQNRYTTKTIDRQVWSTQCRYQLNADAPTGEWKVEMTLGDRVLSRSTFTVK